MVAEASAASAKPTRAIHPFIPFLIRRFVGLVIVLFFLFVTTFFMVRAIPGDPAILAGGPDAREENLAFIRAELGTDKPVFEQFLVMGRNYLRGDFGTSFQTKQPVALLVQQRIGPTAQLAGI